MAVTAVSRTTRTDSRGAGTNAPRPSTEVVHADELGEATEVVARLYAPNRLHATSGNVDMEMQVVQASHVNLGQTKFGVDSVTIEAPPIETYYAFAFAPEGSLNAAYGNDTTVLTPTSGAIVGPTESVRFDNWSRGTTLYSVRIDRHAIESELERLLGTSLTQPLQFRTSIELGSGRGAGVIRALTILREELTHPDGIAFDPILVEGLERIFCASLLRFQPHNYTDRLATPDRPGLPPSVRAAVDAIEADPMAVSTAADLASISFLSLRTLEDAFLRHIGVPPMVYLRQIRLARAREDLRNGNRAITTVSEIAHRWGFFHLGRFASTYRAAYGLTPSDELSR